MKNWTIGIMIIFVFSLLVACRSTEELKSEMSRFKPDVVVEDNPAEKKIALDDQALPDVNFENVTIAELERYYKKNMRSGAVYFVGFEQPESDQVVQYNLFLTGNIKDQLTTIAIKTGSKLYNLNDDYYIVKSPDSSDFDVTAVYVTSLSAEDIRSLLSFYNLQGYTVGLQTVVKGPLLSQVDFSRMLDVIKNQKCVYLIDLAFIDFTLEESTSFQAFLEVNQFDILHLNDFSALFSAYLNCSVENLRSRNFYSQSLLCADGKESSYEVGTTHSREQRSISDQGTSTVSGYANINDGFKLTFKPTACINRTVICTLSMESSNFKGEDYNTKSEINLDVESVPFELGKTYYLSSLTNISKSRSFYLFGLDRASGHRVQTCWTRIRQVK